MEADNSTTDATTPSTVEFHPERTHLLGAAVMTAISLLTVGHAPQLLWWVLLLPLVFVAWVLRSKTLVTADGIATRYLVKKATFTPWKEIDGVAFKGARALLVTTGGKIVMPGVSFNSVPKLAEASDGRIVNVIAEARAATDGKVVVIHRDGRQVLVDKDDAPPSM